MYINLELTEEQQAEIKAKYAKYVEEALTDELLSKCFEKQLEGGIKTVINQITQSQQLRDTIKEKILPLALSSLGLKS